MVCKVLNKARNSNFHRTYISIYYTKETLVIYLSSFLVPDWVLNKVNNDESPEGIAKEENDKESKENDETLQGTK